MVIQPHLFSQNTDDHHYHYHHAQETLEPNYVQLYVELLKASDLFF